MAANGEDRDCQEGSDGKLWYEHVPSTETAIDQGVAMAAEEEKMKKKKKAAKGAFDSVA